MNRRISDRRTVCKRRTIGRRIVGRRIMESKLSIALSKTSFFLAVQEDLTAKTKWEIDRRTADRRTTDRRVEGRRIASRRENKLDAK